MDVRWWRRVVVCSEVEVALIKGKVVLVMAIVRPDEIGSYNALEYRRF